MKSIKSKWRLLALNGTLILLLAAVFTTVDAHTTAAKAASSGGSFTREISSAGTSSFAAAATGSDAIQEPEISGVETDQGAAPYGGTIFIAAIQGALGNDLPTTGISKRARKPTPPPR